MDNTREAQPTIERSQERVDAALDRGGSQTADIDSAEIQAADASLVCLHELLRFPSVAIPAGFADAVMSRVRAERVVHRAPNVGASSRSWLAALAGAAALLAAIALLGGINGVGEESVLSGVAQGMASVALAGAGLLAATWTGVGTSVGSWIGASPTVGAFLALAFVGVALACVGGLRRTRRATQRD